MDLFATEEDSKRHMEMPWSVLKPTLEKAFAARLEVLRDKVVGVLLRLQLFVTAVVQISNMHQAMDHKQAEGALTVQDLKKRLRTLLCASVTVVRAHGETAMPDVAARECTTDYCVTL